MLYSWLFESSARGWGDAWSGEENFFWCGVDLETISWFYRLDFGLFPYPL